MTATDIDVRLSKLEDLVASTSADLRGVVSGLARAETALGGQSLAERVAELLAAEEEAARLRGLVGGAIAMLIDGLVDREGEYEPTAADRRYSELLQELIDDHAGLGGGTPYERERILALDRAVGERLVETEKRSVLRAIGAMPPESAPGVVYEEGLTPPASPA